MMAVVIHGIGGVRLDDVPEPRITHPGDAIVRLTASAIRGTVRTRSLDPTALVSQHTPASSAIEADEQFDRREQGWLKVELEAAA